MTIPSNAKLEEENTFLQLKMSLDFQKNTEDHSYIVIMLISPKYYLLRALVSVLREKRDDAGLKAVVQFIEEEDQTANFVSSMAKRRIKTTSKSLITRIKFIILPKIKKNHNNPESELLLFREDSYDSQFLSAYCATVGKKYLKNVLNPIFEKIKAMPHAFEIREPHIVHKFFLKTNTINILELLKELVDNIQQHIGDLPE